ncbi:VOC family protein [Pseudomonas lijiangensis]|uniref:VOC family protein n=1 Tax=Pseudomonas syringae group TaxID=136849 RepID=UPI001E303C84|nr:VOC family protein [Pseudomonas quasicaspiana]MCD5988491.1 VOC family protein [Pseudomonas quasicaspiana]
MSSNVRGIDHIGITVPDIEAATRFFHAAFDAAVVYDTVVDGQPRRPPEELAATVALKEEQRIVATRMIRLGDGANIELFEIEGAAPGVEGIGSMGLQHFAVYCDDLAQVLHRVSAAGGTPLRGPNALFGIEKGTGNSMHYVRAPWGSLIELISIPTATGPSCEVDRWKPS